MDNTQEKDNQLNQSSLDSNGRKITKKNLLKKYQFHNKDTEVQRKKVLFRENKKSLDLKKSVEFHIIANEDEQIKQLFDQYVEKQKKKKMRQERKKNLTLEELYEQRHKELKNLDVQQSDETNMNLKLEGLRVEIEQTEKIFDNIKYVNKVQQIVQKSKGRLQHTKNITKEEKFSQKLELFKHMKSYVEVDELLKNITVLDQVHQEESEEESRPDSRQDRVQNMLEEMQKEVDSNDDPYKKSFLKRMKLLQRAANILKDKPQLLRNKSKINLKGGLNPQMVDFLKSELESQIQENEKKIQTVEEVGDLQNYKLDNQIAEIIREQERKLVQDQIKLDQKEEEKQNKKYLEKLQNQDQEQNKEVNQADVYKKFLKNSKQIMKYLSNASNQIYQDQVTIMQEKTTVKKKPFKKLSQYFEKKMSLQKEKSFSSIHRNALSRLDKPNYNELIQKYEKGKSNEMKIQAKKLIQVQEKSSENQRSFTDQQLNRQQSLESIHSKKQIQKNIETPQQNYRIPTFLTKLPEMDMKQQIFDALDQKSNGNASKLQLKNFLVQCVQNQMKDQNQSKTPQDQNLGLVDPNIKRSFIKLPQINPSQQSPENKMLERKISMQERDMSKKNSKHKSDRSIVSQQSTLSPEQKPSKYKKINIQIQQFNDFIKTIDKQIETDKAEDNEFKLKINEIITQYEVEMKRFEPTRVTSLQFFDQIQNKSPQRFKNGNFKNEIL